MSQKKNKSIPSTRENRTTPFPKQQIVQIVKEVEEGLSRKEACAIYGMAYCTLGEWMTNYASVDFHLTRRPQFSMHQKRDIVRALQEARMTKEEVHLVHKVGKKTLTTWLREAKQEDNDLTGLNQQDMIMQSKNYSGNELQKQLSEAKLKIKALETMIDIAEEQFKIAIRKKSGAKQ